MAVSRIPVGVATVLMFMSPIWVAILGRFMFGEKLPKSKMVTILICLIGAVFVANLIGGGDIKLDGIGIFSWSDQWCRSSTSDSAPEIFCKRL